MRQHYRLLGAADVRAIRSSDETQQALADRYGVPRCTIRRILDGRGYRWVS
jgi:hypothetical protein